MDHSTEVKQGETVGRPQQRLKLSNTLPVQANCIRKHPAGSANLDLNQIVPQCVEVFVPILSNKNHVLYVESSQALVVIRRL